MKRIVFAFATVFIICLGLTSCGSDDSLIGYWMNEYGDTFVVTDDENCTFDEFICTYSVYDNNHIQFITDDGKISDGKFYFEDGDLYLMIGEDTDYFRYTKDENEQQEISEKLDILDRIESINKKLDAASADLIEYNQMISVLEDDIESRKKHCEEAISEGDDREYQENLRDSFIEADNNKIISYREKVAQLEKEIAEYERQLKALDEDIENE